MEFLKCDITVFTVILWKHWKERTRRVAHSIWEILSGVIVFVILLLLKQVMTRDEKFKNDDFIQSIGLVNIVFVPSNNLSQLLMQEVCSQDFNDPAELNGTIRRCYGFQNEEQVNDFLRRSPGLSFTIITFENLNGPYFPHVLNYSIKYADPTRDIHNLDALYQLFQDDVSIAKNATFFANLQWKIDKAYFEKILGDNVEHKLSIHIAEDHITREMRVIHSFLILCSVLAPFPFFLYTTAKLIDEKRSGIKELLKLAGVSQHVLRYTQLVDTAVFATVYAIVITTLLKVTSMPILPKSNPLIIAVTFVLHFLTITSAAFVTSSLSQNYQYSDSLALLMYLMVFLLDTLWYRPEFGRMWKLYIFYVTLPHAQVFLFWDEVTKLEELGEGAVFSNIFTLHSASEYLPVFVIWVFFIIHLIMMLILAWYLDEVRPGRYGVAARWNFFCHKSYWKKKERHINFHVTSEKRDAKDDRFFEKPKKATKVAIKIAKVTKKFHNFHGDVSVALDGIDFDVYKGLVTVLLGTNGAGKTTLLSIITGMYSATSGTVYINGLDNSARLSELQKDLGYCPQHNLTFDYLTVKENIIFFELLRGGTGSSKVVNAEYLLECLNMLEQENRYSYELSTGQSRCLQLACALVSDAEVLVLDEPTSGMDSEMRHALWDLLLTFRKKKTVLMTTTGMEEADALGDKIALIHNGKLKCFGSPSFLKNAIGTDFKLSIKLVDKTEEKMKKIEELIDTVIKETKVSFEDRIHKMDKKTRFSLVLPRHEIDLFPKVFEVLEANKKELGIHQIDVGISMEQVFLRFIEEDDDLDSYSVDQNYVAEPLLTGFTLRMQQFKWLASRVFTHIHVHRYQFIFLQILVPLCALTVITVSSNTAHGYDRIYVKLTEMNDDKITVFYHPVHTRQKTLKSVMQRYPQIDFKTSEDVRKDISRRSQYGNIGFKMHNNHTEVYVSRLLAPRAVNIFSNMFMSWNVPHMPRYLINTNFTPMSSKTVVTQPKNVYLCFAWSMWVAFLAILPLTPLILLCIEEHQRGARFNHLLAGCPPYLIWLSKMAAHMAIYSAIVPFGAVVVTGFLDSDKTLNRPAFLFSLFLVLLIFGPAFLAHWYAMSFFMSAERPITKIFIVSLVLGLVTPILIHFLDAVAHNDTSKTTRMSVYVIYSLGNLVPAFTLSMALGKLAITARNNALCRLNYHLCPNNMVDDSYFTKEECCESSGEPFVFLSLENGGLELGVLVLQAVIFWILLLLLQNRKIHAFGEKLCLWFYKVPEKRHRNIRVVGEELYVADKMDELRKQKLEERQTDSDVMLVENIYKAYTTGIRTRVTAVNGVSFAIKRGECLVLLGKLGGGKSTTLKMVSGYTTTTRGDICVNGRFIRQENAKYLRNVVLAESTGLDDFLSGHRNLEMLAALYGHEPREAKRIAHRYLRYMGLTAYTNIIFNKYSPGCSHRLGVCIALIGAPSAALLDDSCVSVDPHKRPLVTRAVRHLLDNGTACIVAEESMEWKQINVIGDRLALMDRGELVAIGTVGQIKQEMASGYTATIKLNMDTAYEAAEDNASIHSELSQRSWVPVAKIREMKEEFFRMFPSAIMIDQHMTMLYFHIRDADHKMSYSGMFSNLEKLRKKYVQIEDYTLSETSLEEVICRITHILHGTEEERNKSSMMLKLV